jgi:hypothetical protein
LFRFHWYPKIFIYKKCLWKYFEEKVVSHYYMPLLLCLYVKVVWAQLKT